MGQAVWAAGRRLAGAASLAECRLRRHAMRADTTHCRLADVNALLQVAAAIREFSRPTAIDSAALRRHAILLTAPAPATPQLRRWRSSWRTWTWPSGPWRHACRAYQTFRVRPRSAYSYCKSLCRVWATLRSLNRDVIVVCHCSVPLFCSLGMCHPKAVEAQTASVGSHGHAEQWFTSWQRHIQFLRCTACWPDLPMSTDRPQPLCWAPQIGHFGPMGAGRGLDPALQGT